MPEPRTVTPPVNPTRTSMKDTMRPAESYRDHLERILLTVAKRRVHLEDLAVR